MKKLLLLTLVLVLVLCTGCVNIVPLPSSPVTFIPQTAAPAPTEASAKTDGTQTSAPTQEPPTPQTVPVVTRVKHGYESQRVWMNAFIPVISGFQDASLQEYVNGFFYDEVEAVAMDLSDMAQEKGRDYFVEADFTVGRNDGTLLSIREQVVYYEQDSVTNIFSVYFTILNTKPGVKLSLKDLFLPNSNYIAFINGEIEDAIKSNPDNYFEDQFTGIDPDQHYYITDSELVIVFEKNEIAPGSAGEPEFRIPYGELSDIINSWLM